LPTIRRAHRYQSFGSGEGFVAGAESADHMKGNAGEDRLLACAERSEDGAAVLVVLPPSMLASPHRRDQDVE
jgi:hypothetical protein